LRGPSSLGGKTERRSKSGGKVHRNKKKKKNRPTRTRTFGKTLPKEGAVGKIKGGGTKKKKTFHTAV